jgi:hypothetical protein
MAILRHPMTRPARITLLAAALVALTVAPTTAQAAYAPKIAVTINPTNKPDSFIALTSVVSQASDEEPTKSARVHFPPGVSISIDQLGRTESCSPAQRDAQSCPAGSRLGTATADTDVGTLTGGVFLGQASTIFIFLKNPTLALLGKEPGPITAHTEFRADGGTDTVLDNLPTDITATRFELALDGPPRSILKSPEVCGLYKFSGDFVSKSGVKASSSTSVTFTNCPPPAPALSKVKLSRRSVRVGTNVAISYVLSRAAQVEVTVRRSGKRKILGRSRFADGEGASRVRVVTRRLTAGPYIVTVKATANGQSASSSRALRITPKPR